MGARGVERAGRWEGTAAPTGARASRPLSARDLIAGFTVLLALCLAGAVAWALIVFALIGVFL